MEVDRDEARDEDAPTNTSRQRGGVKTKVGKAVSVVALLVWLGEVLNNSRHDGSTLVEEENIGDRQRSEALSRAIGEAHENPSGQYTAVRGRSASPSCAGRVHRKGKDVERPASVLDHDGHPDQVAHALEEGSSREKV